MLHDGAHVLAVEPVRHRVDHSDHRDHAGYDQRELPAVEQHQPERENDDQGVHEHVERDVVDEGADLHCVVHAREDLADPHRIEELLGQRQEMPVIAEDQRPVDALAGSQRQQALHAPDHHPHPEERDHDHAHQIEQIAIPVDQDVIDDLLHVDRSGEPEQGEHQGPDERLRHHRSVGSEQLPEAPCQRHGLVAAPETLGRREQHEHTGPRLRELVEGLLVDEPVARIHDDHVFRGHRIDHHEVREALPHHDVRNRRRGNLGEALDRPLYALGREAEGGGGLDQTEHVRPPEVGRRILPEAGDGERPTVMGRHGLQARRGAIRDVVLLDAGNPPEHEALRVPERRRGERARD